jgi:regulatory protein
MQAGFEQPAIENALERAKAYGFIDDHRYADVLIRSRLSQGKGIQGIIRELASQQIDIEEVPGWPEEFEIDEDRELERALAFLERKPPRSKNQREGAYRKLMGGGFSSSVASSAARIWAEQRPDTRF